LILDDETEHGGPATPFTRIWCAYEVYVALTDYDRHAPLVLDIAASRQGNAELITQGYTRGDIQQAEDEDYPAGYELKFKMERERSFPSEILQRGIRVELHKAQASMELDRTRILNLIAGQDIDAAPLDNHSKYDLVNAALRSTCAVAAWPQAVATDSVEAMGLPGVLKTYEDRQDLALSFYGMEELRNSNVATLSGHLPLGLRNLDLNFAECGEIGDASLVALGNGIGKLTGLRSLNFDFALCGKVGDAGVAGLAKGIAKLRCLTYLKLRFSWSDKIRDAGVISLGACLDKLNTLLDLVLDFADCDKIGDAGAVGLVLGLEKLEGLQSVGLNLAGTQASADKLMSAQELEAYLHQMRERGQIQQNSDLEAREMAAMKAQIVRKLRLLTSPATCALPAERFELLKCLQTVRTYISNVANNPVETKFRSIRTTNKAFLARVACFPEAVKLLRACGFVADGESLVMSHVHRKVLWDAAKLLEVSAEQLEALPLVAP